MLRDVFYYGAKPNVHPRERHAESLEDARNKASTSHFWVINEFCNYKNFDWDFDFEFLPDEDVWAEEHNNVWPSQHQKDSGTWLCPKEHSDLIIYRADVEPVRRNNIKTDNWVELDLIDQSKFDFSWHPDPSDPPYIYKWGNKFAPVQFNTVLEYHTPGATQIKYMDAIVELLPNDYWIEVQAVDKDYFDMSWRPDPMDPPFIYIWGNKYVDGKLKSTLEYHAPGATDKKYMPELLRVLPVQDKWVEVQAVDKSSFDFSWRPDPREPAYIYTWGNKYISAELRPTLEYHCEGATERKYMDNSVGVLPEWDKWEIIHPVHKDSFDFSWRPDPREPNMNYVFGHSQYDSTKMPTIIYKMEGATDEKHMPSFAKLLPQVSHFEHLEDSNGIDYSWVPDPTAPPYIYAWGNQWNKPEDKISIQWVVDGATEYQYMEERATRKPCMDNWVIPKNVDTSNFDFSWEPSPAEPAFIYQFGTQWQKTGGPQYVVEGATEVKFIDITKAKALPTQEKWTLPKNLDVTDFDFSWHPDDTDPAYIYQFPTQWALSGGPMYTVDGATEIKYVEDMVAKALPDKTNWEVPADVDSESFDFSWHPYAQDEPYVYQFGTQWQKTGGPVFNTPGVHKNSAVKYIDTRILKSKRLPSKKGFATLDNLKIKDFDYSWHPDTTEEPYIYVFGNNQYPAEIMPTIEYAVPGATKIKYVNDIIATLDTDKTNWEIPKDIDDTGFDYSWKPNPKDPAFIYEFGTQWQKTGGPRYVVEGATEVKYIDTLRVKRLPVMTNWTVPSYIDKDSFDFSWHPDATTPSYIYHFPTQWALSGGPVYHVEGATEVKYVEDQSAKAITDKTNWEYYPDLIDEDSFDFSWHPYLEDQPYRYIFGTQHQKTGGPMYVTPGCHKNSPVKYIDTRILKAKRLPNLKNWHVVDDVKLSSFDYSWHPDDTEEPYIYVFGNNLYPGEVMPTVEYRVSGATQVKYVNSIIATLAPDRSKWNVPEDIDDTGFDYSWKPNPKDPPFIYEFGTQWQKTDGPRYVVKDATEVKYIDTQKVKKLPSTENWDIPSYIDRDSFDFSWHPDATSPKYNYNFPTQWALSGGPTYKIEGAIEVKYVEDQKAKALSDKTNWEYYPDLIDEDSFDFSWHPYVEDQPYVYVFGTQHQKTGGPKYITPGCHKNSPVKYIDTRILKAKRLMSLNNYTVVGDLKVFAFDYSWHPDDTEEPYIYQFGNQYYDAETMPTVQYKVPGATQVKYVSGLKATLAPDRTNWEIPKNVDATDFDFTWKPNPHAPPYIYEFGTQWQKTDGPRYVVEGATEVKYVDGSKGKRLPSEENWTVPDNIDITGFDFSWHPDSTSPPYMYVFATQWALSGGPVYTVPGATELKFAEEQSAKALPDRTNWEYFPNEIDVEAFDFSWHPYLEDQPYIYQFGTQWQKTGGPQYIAPGATKESPMKYIDPRIIKAKRLPNRDNWQALEDYTVVDFDYSWHPDETEEPYIYVFGNQYHSAEVMPTIQFKVKNATQIKYVNKPVASLAPDMNNWSVPKDIDAGMFDFSWKPSPLDPPYIYQFGTQWAKTRGPRYVVPNAKDVKYIDIIKARALPKTINWEVPSNIDVNGFDFSWHPDDTEPAYIYQFGTQWALTGGPRYVVPGATEVKYVEGLTAKSMTDMTNWEVPNDIAKMEFDFSWHPYAEDDPFIYQFGTQHQKTGGPRYVVPGATKIKYVDTRVLKARKLPTKKNWDIPATMDVSKFDFSWHPDDTAGPVIYQFGTIVDPTDGPRYITPNNNGDVVNLERIELVEVKKEEYAQYLIETTLEDLVEKHIDEVFWALNPDLDYSEFDFNWRPSIEQAHYVHAFGTRDNMNTQTYFVNGPQWFKGNSEINYVEDQKVDIKVNIDMFYVDRGNKEATARFEMLKAKFGNKIQKTRYLNSWVDTINRCINRATSNLLWVLNSELDYTGFDFDYYPNPWQMKMVNVFGTQWSHWGTTFMVNRETFANDTKYVKIIEHLTNLNFVKENRAKATKALYEVYVIDHGNPEVTSVVDQIKQKVDDKIVTVVKYNESYLNTLREIISKQPEKKEHYLWLCSSICDYRDFDFSYICDPFAKDQLHVFPSGKQKFGDTFFIDVNKTRELISEMKVLEDYHKVNYNSTLRAQRLPEPTIVTSKDTMVEAVKNIGNWPYATLITEDNNNIEKIEVEPMNMWQPDTKTIIVTSTGASRIIVPREVNDYVKKELYDYPYIKKSAKLAKSNPMDIVFLSNGETGADENYEHLLRVTKGLKNRVVRVDGVNGRVAAYHAAVEASDTPWAFTVFAKLKVSPKFDWNWQPDRMQIPKHYIFQAKNPVNGLIYGHQAMIAYNKKLTLANDGKGLDFTLDDEHEVVELLSGTAIYNTDPFSTWRTAFREVLKLKAEDSDIARERLDAWMNKAEGDFAQFSIKGAVDADEFYEEVDGDFNQLKLSYEWAWLLKRFEEL